MGRRTLALWLARASLGLTISFIVMIVGSLLLHLQGGHEHKVVDVVQFVVAWGYVLATPVLSGSALLLRIGNRAWSIVAIVVLGFWTCVLVASSFVHL
jgi:hypothetical protein